MDGGAQWQACELAVQGKHSSSIKKALRTTRNWMPHYIAKQGVASPGRQSKSCNNILGKEKES